MNTFKFKNVRPVYSKIAFKIFKAVYVMANMTREEEMRKYWIGERTTQYNSRIDRYFDSVVNDIDGQVCFNVRDYYKDREFEEGCIKREFIKMLNLMKEDPSCEQKYGLRKEPFEIMLLIFKNATEARILKAFSRDAAEAVIGKPANPLVVSQREVVINEIEFLRSDRDAAIYKMNNSLKAAIDKLTRENDKAQSELKADYDKKIALLEKKLARI